ncbi:hypothetical protein Pryu01_00015 [Paraliobacillus ryukyuensis]|uniref:YlbE-like protein n=1 Tax=Paraliobacillus ryukyuensis TaxID=200904 RepID=A0A366EHU1_9BACI|nr:YlbE-like family protein [Paraliobacillus ryukyuensis]RBP01913.1 YlbE-like protein [Paraliobacillus ryukyuensis]
MEPTIYQKIKAEPALLRFLRNQPNWYRTLARNPEAFEDLQKQAKQYQGRTIPQRVEKISEQMQLLGMFLHMASTMKD